MADAFVLHKPIRNKIRQYDRDALLNITMNVLLKNEKEFHKNNGYIPWECMLLIRWILQYASPGKHLKKPSLPIVNQLLNEIKNIGNQFFISNLSDPHGLNKFMRRMAFQQFTYQMHAPEVGWKAGRQIILFNEIGEKYGVNNKFETQTGLSIKVFLGISFAIFSLLEKDNVFSVTTVALASIFSPETVQKFFELVAITPAEAKNFLDDDAKKKGKRFIIQLYELSPLVRKPFLKLGENYVVFSKRLFRQFFSNFIYDFLFDLPGRFEEFGDILEKYVRQQLEGMNFDMIPDNSWKKILKKQLSVPDFTIIQEDATTFIESKRKHVPDILKVMQTNDTLARHLDDSIVNGVVQIYSLANELIQQKPNQIRNLENLYGVIVSFKDHYLRGGQQFWDEFLRDEISEKLNLLKIDPNLIPPENIFLLSVDEFDYLMAFLAKNPSQTFNAVFTQIKEFEADPQRSSYFFQDHLARISGGKTPRPEHLWNRMAGVIEEVTSKVQLLQNESIKAF